LRFPGDGSKLRRRFTDEDGLELDSLEAAEHEAVLTAVQLGRDWLPQAREVRLAVRDGQRRLVLTLNLALVIERELAAGRLHL
jgi:hypothetical protein